MNLFFNGSIIEEKDFRLPVNDRGLLLGDGLFETLRAYNGKIVFILDHWQRLNQGATVLGLNLPLTFLEFEQGLDRVLQANLLQEKEAVLRLTITRGAGPRGLLPPAKAKPNIILTAEALPPLEKQSYTLRIADTRRNQFSPLANIKSLNYLDNILARQEAERLGADEAVLLNTDEFIAGSSAANLFLIRDGMLQTPRLQDGALAGIMRKNVLLLAQEINFVAVEMQLAIQDLLTADEIFLTNSILGIMPVHKINEKDISTGAITKKMQTVLQKYIIYAAQK